MLQLKKSSWKLAFTPDSIHQHREDIENADKISYTKEKKSTSDNDRQYFYNKWNISMIVTVKSLRFKIETYLMKLKHYIKNDGVIYTLKKIMLE